MESIEDVTEMAAKLREVVEMKRAEKEEGRLMDVEELINLGCLPREMVYEVDEEAREWLMMN